MTGGDETRAEARVRICNRLGLHTRPAKAFVKVASRFTAQVQVVKEGRQVDGKSIMGMMSLAAPRGTVLQIEATGDDAADAVEALRDLVAGRFGED